MYQKKILNLKSLKDQVYDYLRIQMQKGKIQPGSIINMDEKSQELGVSKTPLRDALIQLEMEGFVKVMPRRGVVVNVMSLKDIKEYYQVIGALESTALLSASAFYEKSTIKEMEMYNKKMKIALGRDNFDSYYRENLKFHNSYLNLCGNRLLKKTVDNLKKRLYDFPRPKKYIKEWEETLILEHEKLVNFISEGEFLKAANFIRDVHWSFDVQKEFVMKYYNLFINR